MICAISRASSARKPAAKSSKHEGRLPNYLIACVGGGSNAMGLFHAFLNDADVKMIGVEAGGRGLSLGEHAARFLTEGGGRIGVLQGTRSYVLQDERGQISLTHSVSAGLDYASVGPEHANLHDLGRAEYRYASDAEALAAFQLLAQMEGIIPALESSHAIAEVVKLAPQLAADQIILVNLSGRGDKDVNTVAEQLAGKI
jgi:tryptophan synthase beta chain